MNPASNTPLVKFAFEHPDHLCNGRCPDEGYMDSRDPECEFCWLMDVADHYARVKGVLCAIRQWDMLDVTADRPHWKRTLDVALANGADEPPARERTE